MLLVDARSVVGGVGRLPIMRRIFLNLLVSLYSSFIGLAVKPAVICIDSVNMHLRLAEPTHETIPVVCISQTSRLIGRGLLERHRSITRGKALCRSGQHSAHRKGVRIAGRLVFSQHGCQDSCRTRAGEVNRRLHAFAVYGDIQFVVHRPLVSMLATKKRVIDSSAHGTGAEVVIMLFPQLARDVAFVVPGTESGTGYRTITRKGINRLLGCRTLAKPG